MKKPARLSSLLILCLLPATAVAATSVSQYGITWSFGGDYEVGHFVTGDYYVIDSGLGVVIQSLTPAPSDGVNGSMINPSTNVQAYDKDADTGGGDYDASLGVAFPVTLHAGQSLISTETITTQNTDWNGVTFESTHRHINTAAVLTCLSAAPPAGTFRPPYVGTERPLYNVSQINTNVLPRLSMSGFPVPTDGALSGIAMLERGFERPWILHGNDWMGRQIHPIQNMHNYHENISEYWGKAMAFLMTDQYTSTLLYRYLQTAIDAYYAITLSQPSDSAQFATPIILAGLLLGDTHMQNVFVDDRANIMPRGHEKFYYYGDRTLSQMSSIVPVGQTWTGWVSEAGKAVFFAKQVGDEYEHLHPSEWLCYSPHCKGEVYRTQHDVHGLVGQIFAIRMLTANGLDAARLYDHDATLDYMDRWMQEGFMTEEYQDTGRTYYEEFQYYRPTTIYSRNYQSGGSSFVDAMWGRYRNDPGPHPRPAPPTGLRIVTGPLQMSFGPPAQAGASR